MSTAQLPELFIEQQISRCSSSTTSEFQIPSHGREFLSFRSRQGSDVSYSGSSGIASINQAPGVLPGSTLFAGEDEIWKEYDDLLNEHLSPASDCSARSSHGFPAPSTFAASLSTANLPSAGGRPSHTDLPAITAHSGPESRAIPWSAPAVAPAKSRAPQTSDSGRSPVLRDYISGPAERGITVDARPDSTAAMPPLVRNVHSPQAFPAVVAEMKQQQQQQHSRPSSCASEPTKKGHNVLDAEMDLRLEALMASRWLSFGRVLFSPAHDGIKQVGGSGRHERLLVLDGLGNGTVFPCFVSGRALG